MSQITLTEKQNKALKETINWYKYNNDQRIWTIAGVAGSGKSTLVKFIINELNLGNNVAYCAFTGMAAGVLTKKGNPATTIHKLIYNTKPMKDKKGKTYFVFELKEELDEHISLIIVDEVSMVSEKMLNELKSFGIKILAMGDKAQLPPPANSYCKLLDKPDIFLDEPLRQSLDNPIIYVANKARLRENIQYGTYGDSVQVVSKDHLSYEMFMFADQILAGRNNTVVGLNNFYRRNILKINTPIPQKGEKIICLKNNWEQEIIESEIQQFLVNGLLGRVESDLIIKPRTKTFEFDFRPEYFEKEKFKKITGDLLYFTDGIRSDDEIFENEEKYMKELMFRKNMTETIDKFTYGNVITVYKSQGNEFNNVFYVDEVLNRSLYYEHLYTAITRAKEKIIIAK